MGLASIARLGPEIARENGERATTAGKSRHFEIRSKSSHFCSFGCCVCAAARGRGGSPQTTSLLSFQVSVLKCERAALPKDGDRLRRDAVSVCMRRISFDVLRLLARAAPFLHATPFDCLFLPFDRAEHARWRDVHAPEKIDAIGRVSLQRSVARLRKAQRRVMVMRLSSCRVPSRRIQREPLAEGRDLTNGRTRGIPARTTPLPGEDPGRS